MQEEMLTVRDLNDAGKHRCDVFSKLAGVGMVHEQKLADVLQDMPIFSTHEHHREDAFHRKLDLTSVFSHSYVGWCGPVPDSPDQRGAFLDSVRYNAYFVWLQKAIQSLYKIDEPISNQNWDMISERISQAHRDPAHHRNILTQKCGYITVIQDSYWDPGSDLGDPELFQAAFRIDSFLSAFHKDARDHDGMNALVHFDQSPPTLEALIAWMEEEIRGRRSAIVALKCAAAYARGLDFDPPDEDRARHVFGQHPNDVSAMDRKVFSDYVFHHVCRIAADLELPIQVHVGLAKIRGSNPMYFEPVIARYSNVRFMLLHGGFPWYHEIAGLAHNYANVLLDLSWLPLISPTSAMQALHIFIEVARSSGIITWGGDNWTSEESFGATLAFKHVLHRVLSEKVSDGYLSMDEAIRLAHKIACQNARAIFLS